MFTKRRKVKRGWMNLKVVRLVQETHDSKTIFFVDADEGCYQFDYFAGQYLTFRFDNLSKPPAVRSYTMSSFPRQKNEVAITVKKIDKGFISDYLCDQIKLGDILRARGPIGKFVFDATNFNSHLVMIAGGSGITPFYSIAKEYENVLGSNNCPEKLTIVVSYKSKNDLIFYNDLVALNKKKNIEVVIFLTREKDPVSGLEIGRLDEKRFLNIFDQDLSNKTFMVCGPDPLTDLVKKSLEKNSVSLNNFITESFVN
jgi:ferredoxin-NADP reductase